MLNEKQLKKLDKALGKLLPIKKPEDEINKTSVFSDASVVVAIQIKDNALLEWVKQRFISGSEIEEVTINKLEWSVNGKSLVSLEYFKLVLNVFDAISETVSIQVAKDYPICLENDMIKCIIAPRCSE